jgi:hypothetical protein
MEADRATKVEGIRSMGAATRISKEATKVKVAMAVLMVPVGDASAILSLFFPP